MARIKTMILDREIWIDPAEVNVVEVATVISLLNYRVKGTLLTMLDFGVKIEGYESETSTTKIQFYPAKFMVRDLPGEPLLVKDPRDYAKESDEFKNLQGWREVEAYNHDDARERVEEERKAKNGP